MPLFQSLLHQVSRSFRPRATSPLSPNSVFQSLLHQVSRSFRKNWLTRSEEFDVSIPSSSGLSFIPTTPQKPFSWTQSFNPFFIRSLVHSQFLRLSFLRSYRKFQSLLHQVSRSFVPPRPGHPKGWSKFQSLLHQVSRSFDNSGLGYYRVSLSVSIPSSSGLSFIQSLFKVRYSY